MLINLKKNVAVKYILELIFMIGLYAVLDNVGGIKKYAFVLFFCVAFMVFGIRKRWHVEALFCVSLPVFTYVLLGSFSALLGTTSQITTAKVILYTLVPLLFSFSTYMYYGEKMQHIVDVHFCGSILAYAIFDAPYFAKIFQWESIYAFVFGLFVIYYAYRKKWLFSVVSVCFVYFAEKRIAILAVCFTLLLMGIVWLFEKNKKLVYAFWGIITCAVFGYIFLIHSGIMEAFCWGANINTNGRVEMYSRMAEEAKFSLGYFGRGLGIVEQLLEYYNVSTYVNLHNDLLKFYIELGFIGLLVYLLSYGVVYGCVNRYFGKSKMCFFFAISAYTMMLFATDNASIYMIYLIPMYTTMFAVLASDRQIKIEKG